MHDGLAGGIVCADVTFVGWEGGYGFSPGTDCFRVCHFKYLGTAGETIE